MHGQSSFEEILEEKLTKDTPFVSGVGSCYTENDPAHLAFLLGRIPRKTGHPRGKYSSTTTRPQRKPHQMTPDQRLSFDFFRQFIPELSDGFTKTELRKAFRQGALRLHPDQGGTITTFLEFKEHYEVLKKIGPQ